MKKRIFNIKIVVMLSLCLCIIGCTAKKLDAHTALLDIVENDYPDSNIIGEKSEEPYYLALLKDKDEITLVILENKDGNKYFGGSSYNFSKQSFGKCVFINDNILVIVFSENKNKYSKISLEYSNVSNENESIVVNTYVNENDYILNMYLFSSKYHISKVNLE